MRGPVEGGDKVKIASVADASPISYPLAQIPNSVSYETVSEQPEAEPNQPVNIPISFHGGLAYSKYDPRTAGYIFNSGFLTSEPNVIRAPNKRNPVTLTGAANPPQYSFEATVNDSGADDGQPVLYIIAPEAAEINVYKISMDSGDFGTLLNTKTFAITPTQPCCRPAEWNNGSNTYWTLGLGDNGKIQQLTSIVSSTSADTWTASADADARHLKVVGNQLMRSTDENQVSILPRGSDPMTEANWGGDFFVGDVSANVTELGEASGLGYVAKEDGFYEWDLVGEAVNIFPEIGDAPRNGQGMIYWHGGFMIPAGSGLWWTRTGKPVGPDSNPENRANNASLGNIAYLKHGRWMGLAGFGEYLYGLYINDELNNSTSAILMLGRERDSSDPPGWGPIVWQAIGNSAGDRDDFHGAFIAETSEFGSSDVRPTVWIPATNNALYWWLEPDGALLSRRGDIELITTGSAMLLVSGTMDGGFPQIDKQLHWIEGWAENVEAGASDHTFTFIVYLDGGASTTVGAVINTDGFFRRFWTQDSNDVAKQFLLGLGFGVGTDETSQDGPFLRDVILRAVLLPRVTREWTFLFGVEDEQAKTAKKIRSELEAYVGDLKKYTLPDRDVFNGVMGKPRLLRADEISRLTPRNQEPPTYVISASVRELAGS